jgi:hypothetical protein
MSSNFDQPYSLKFAAFALTLALCACAVSPSRSDFTDQDFIGTWSTGSIESGKGFYSEEAFLPDGRFCSLTLDLEDAKLETSSGTWDAYAGSLNITVNSVSPARKNHIAGTEVREVDRISKQAYSFPLNPVPVRVEMTRASTTVSGKWCDATSRSIAGNRESS